MRIINQQIGYASCLQEINVQALEIFGGYFKRPLLLVLKKAVKIRVAFEG